MYLRLLMFLPPILILACNSFSLGFLKMCSAYRLNKQGDRRQPCHTPFSILTYQLFYIGFCFLLTRTQDSQETSSMVCYSHLSKSFPWFFIVHTVKGFSLVEEQYEMIFWTSLDFYIIQQFLAIWCPVALPFLNPAWTSGISWFAQCWSLVCKILSMTLLAWEMSATVWWLTHSLVLTTLLGNWDEDRSFPVPWSSRFADIMNANPWWHPPLGICQVLLEFHHIH